MVKARMGTVFAAIMVAFSFNSVTMPGAMADDTVGGASGEVPLRLSQNLQPQTSSPLAQRIRKNYWLAYQMANNPDLDKAAEADPSIIAAICSRPGPAKILAKHRHL